MKNEATTPQASDAWRAAMRAFDRELQRRGAAERTRRAYGVDLGQLALWSSANGVEPDAVDYPVLRRYAAQLAGRGAGPRTVARKLAAIRSFFTSMVELGEMTREPRGPAAGAEAAAAAAAHAQGRGRGGAAEPDPGHHAARAARPRDVRAGLRVRAARGGAREPGP